MEIDGQPANVEQLATQALYGYGHFTSMRVEDGRVRGLSLHLQRLVHDCRALFDAELDPQRIRQLLGRAAAGSSSMIVRVTVFAPDLELAHPGARLEPRLLVSTRPAATRELPPLRLRSMWYERELPEVKHTGLFGTIYHRRLAQRAGVEDVLFVDGSGRVSEGATWNIGFLDGEHLVWPDAACLPGVTMRLITSLADELGIRCTTRRIGVADLDQMHAALITNAAVGVRPVEAIDQVMFETGSELVKQLQDAYTDYPGELV